MSSLYINTNLTALAAQRAVNRATNNIDTAYNHLSSGLKINSAKDDPAGVQTSDRLTLQINSLSMTNRNAQDAISYAQTAEGAIEEITTMLQRIRTLAVQSANGVYSQDNRRALQDEVDQLNEEIGRIARDTTFGGQDLLSGNASIVRFQISPAPGSIIEIDLATGFDMPNLAKMAAKLTGSDDYELPPDAGVTPSRYNFVDIFNFSVNGGGVDITSQSKAQIVLAGIDYLITAVDSKRSELGAVQNRLEATIRNQDNVKENVSDSRARIRDTDYAEEVSNMVSEQMKQQGSISILTQANQKPQIALQMLQDQ